MTDRTDELAAEAIAAANRAQMTDRERELAESFKPYRKAQDAEAAKQAGCTVDELRAARAHGMDVSEYLAYRDVRSPAEAAQVEAEAKARAEAKAEAERQNLIAEEAKSL